MRGVLILCQFDLDLKGILHNALRVFRTHTDQGNYHSQQPEREGYFDFFKEVTGD